MTEREIEFYLMAVKLLCGYKMADIIELSEHSILVFLSGRFLYI